MEVFLFHLILQFKLLFSIFIGAIAVCDIENMRLTCTGVINSDITAVLTSEISEIYISNSPKLDLKEMTLASHISIKKLSLKNCSIFQFSSDMVPNDIEALDLSHNGLTRITHNTFLNLNLLEYLDLSHNNLSKLSDSSFNTLKSLKFLYLSNNSIDNFPLLTNLPVLNFVDVSYNQIKNVDEKVSSQDIYPAEFVNFANNPLNCSCKLLWLKELFDRREYVFKQFDGSKSDFIPSCASPEFLAGESWDVLGDDVFKCRSQEESKSSVSKQRGSLALLATTIKTHSVVVEWSPTRSPIVTLTWYMFGRRTSTSTRRQVPGPQRKFVVQNLSPDSSYVICVQEGAEELLPPVDQCVEVMTQQELTDDELEKLSPEAQRNALLAHIGTLLLYIWSPIVLPGLILLLYIWVKKPRGEVALVNTEEMDKLLKAHVD